ncbi:hypothetical protein GCM10018785_29260 [Streptomyces longispororuber]|uniref:DUF4097 domain-containing protein n=1 Tax=Streptomyces longispororuber TaxID=68230 RepID=A0A918ZKU4_9ACTN|nr:DUF4097 family beta strand repeat-containing protein [Streptomyces longispororuber]GHE58166.1 hypothetical protein GCM10018785_29260 [Streptomyces longispororuber]
MPTFPTPAPISAKLRIAEGSVTVRAAPREVTVVEVRPTDGSDPRDVRAADEAHVAFSEGRLDITSPPQARAWARTSRRTGTGTGSVDVLIELPEGSALQGTAATVVLRGDGRLGECRFEAGRGDIELDEAGPLRLTTGSGVIGVARAVGRVRIANGSGQVRVDVVDGSAQIGNDDGLVSVGDATGKLRLSGVSGDFHVLRAQSDVEVKTAHGTVRLAEVVRGTVVVTASFGQVEIGVREGTAAKLDVSTLTGVVRHSLRPVEGPHETDDVVHVRVRTYNGSVSVDRS